jgi:PEGA domain-containing protein
MRPTAGSSVVACATLLVLASGGASPLHAQGPKRDIRWRCTLVLYSKPAGKITIDDDSLVGQTPKYVTITAGTHKIRISRDGYLPWETVIDIEGGETLRITDIVLKQRPKQGADSGGVGLRL